MDPQAFQSTRAGRVVRAPAHGGYYAFVPRPLPPEIEWQPGLVGILSEAGHALGELAGVGRSLPNPHLLIRPFVHREAVLSSRIEGTRASLSDLYAYEAGQLALFESTSDAREVYNYVQALDFGLERCQALPLSSRLLREIHGRLLEGVRGGRLTPGEFRNDQNWVGPPGSTQADAPFVAPPVHELRGALDALEKFLHAESELPRLVRIGLAHYQFEAIHPFFDGNGRMGRLLITFLLCAWGLLPQPLLYLSVFFERNRAQYYDLLMAVSQRGAWEEWLTFFLQGVAVQARDALERTKRLLDLRESYRQRFQAKRTAARLLQVLDLLYAQPIVTISGLADRLGVAYSSAEQYVARLEEAGILREVTGRSRDRVFLAEGVLRAVEEPLPASDEMSQREGQG